MLPYIEVVVALGMLFDLSRPYAGLAAAILLAVYGIAMAINLNRGRSSIDCGCGDTPQPLSSWLVVRNFVLAAGAILTLAPIASRQLTALDMFFAVIFVVACSLCYTMMEHLSRNYYLLTHKE
ncbi:MAG: hypothetical protein KKD00_00005 [Gammaproteobacteria bacterium]|nr:hypothetical protein [Gammaproteobacteria bacterium]